MNAECSRYRESESESLSDQKFSSPRDGRVPDKILSRQKARFTSIKLPRLIDDPVVCTPLCAYRGSGDEIWTSESWTREHTDFSSKFSKSLRRLENRVNFLLSPPQFLPQYPPIRSKGYYTLSFVRQLGGRREGTTTPKLSLGGNPVKEVEPESKVPEAVWGEQVATSFFINNSQRRAWPLATRID